MNREIKFRAWDGFQKKMFEIKSLKLPHREDLSPEVYLMQFTGLLDKNGKEIYESDIIKMDAGTDEESICTVDWMDGGFVLIGKNYNGEHIGAQIRSYDDKKGMFGEIIGNVFEHPELITP